MQLILDAMRQFLDANGWKYMTSDDRTLRGLIAGDAVRWEWIFSAEDQLLGFHSMMPVLVPKTRRAAVAEYLTWVNYGLKLGNFEMDLRDGEVRCKTSTPVEEDNPPSRRVIERVVYGNFNLMDRYLPGLLAVVYGNEAPRKAVRRMETDTHEEPGVEEPEENDSPLDRRQRNPNNN